MVEFSKKLDIKERDFVVIVSREHAIDFNVVKEI